MKYDRMQGARTNEKSLSEVFFLLYADSRREKVHSLSLSLSLSSLAACIYPRMELGCFSSCSPLLQPPWLLSCALVLAFIRRHPEEEVDARAHTHTAHSKGDEEKMDSLIFIQKKEYTDSSSSICPCRQPKKRRRDCLAWLGLAFYGFLSSSP